jgi:hypothetical protein
MPEGESTIAELDRLTEQLMSAGKGAEHFQEAVKQASAALDAASIASETANAALSAGQAEYALLEKAAVQAAKAAEKAAKANEGVIPFELAAKAAEAEIALDHQADTLRRLEREAEQAAAAEAQFSRELKNVKTLSSHVDRSLQQQAERLGKLQGALGAVGGPLGRLGQGLISPVKGFTELSQSMGSARAAALLGAVGFAAAAAAVVAITVAAIAGTVAIAAWAVGLADSARSAGLAQEAAEIMTPEIEGLHDAFEDLTARTGLSNAALSSLAKQLVDAKTPTDELEDSLHTAAIAQRALGESGSAEFIKLTSEANAAAEAAEKAGEKMGGVVPKALQEKVDATAAALNEFAGKAANLESVVAQQMRGLDAQSEKFKKNVGSLFGGLNIDPVLDGLARLVALFDENTEAGQAMKFLFESVFQPLIDQADAAAIVIERFVLGFLIGLTQVYISIKPALAAVKDFLGFDDTSLSDTLGMVQKAGEYLVPAFLVLVGIFGALVVAVGAAIAAIVAIQVAIYSFYAAVIYVGAQIVDGFIGAWERVKTFFGALDFGKLGSDLIDGFVGGITGNAGKVVAAITGVVSNAVNAAKQALGIASPSKVFAGIGEFTGEGFTEGVEDTAGDAQAAIEKMTAPPRVPSSPLAYVRSAGGGDAPAATATGGAGAAQASSGPSISLTGPFNFYGVKDAEEAEGRFSELLTMMIKGDADRLAGAQAGAP